jgi:hypothetical protein
VRASERTIQHFQSHIYDCEQNLQYYPDSDGTRTQFEAARNSLILCTTATTNFNSATVNEWSALDRLGERQCSNTPWLLGLAQGKVRSSIQEEATVGGYTAFLLMTKLNARPLNYHEFCTSSIEERNEIREAFAVALK